MALTEPSIGSTTTSVPGSPKSISPRSSLTAVKRSPSSCRRSSCSNTASSAAASIIERAVAALAARADLEHALGRGGPIREDRPQRVGRLAADVQPVRVLHTIGDPHRAYPTVVQLTPRQLEAVAHPGGPLLVVGGAGTGKTTVLCERFAWLVREGGLAPESILALTVSEAAADRLRERLESGLDGGFEELTVATVHGFCARVLHDEALEAGLDPFAAPVTPADRLAMLLERIDELPLASHDIRGNPSQLIGSIVARIDRLKDELVSHEDYAAWAGHARRRRPTASASSPPSTPPTTAGCEESGSLDFGDLVLDAFRLLRTQARVRARVSDRFRHVLVDELQDANFAQGLLLRLLAGEHGQISAAGDDDQAIHRLRGAAAKNLRDFEAEWPAATVVRLEESHRCPERVLAAARAVVEPAPDRIEKELHGRHGRRRRVLAVRQRARAGADGRRRDRAARRARGRRARRTSACSCARCATRARPSPSRSRSARCRTGSRARPRSSSAPRCATCSRWLRLLVDPGDAGAVVRALARPPVELRAIDIARCTQIARRRKLDMVAALGAALESPQIPPEARERIRTFFKLYRAASAALDSSRPDLYVHRLIERLGLRRQLLFAASVEVVERLVNLAKFAELAAAYVRRSPQATAREFARSIAAVAEAGLREEEAVAGDRPVGVQVMAMHAAKGLEFDHVYVLGLMGARMPGPRRRTLEPIPDALLKETLPARLEGRAHRGDAAPAAHGDDPRAAAARARLPRDDRPRRRPGPVAVRRGGACRRRRRVGGASARSCSGPPRRCSRRSGSCATSC